MFSESDRRFAEAHSPARLEKLLRAQGIGTRMQPPSASRYEEDLYSVFVKAAAGLDAPELGPPPPEIPEPFADINFECAVGVAGRAAPGGDEIVKVLLAEDTPGSDELSKILNGKAAIPPGPAHGESLHHQDWPPATEAASGETRQERQSRRVAAFRDHVATMMPEAEPDLLDEFSDSFRSILEECAAMEA